jgi:hypothetical protein
MYSRRAAPGADPDHIQVPGRPLAGAVAVMAAASSLGEVVGLQRGHGRGSSPSKPSIRVT